MKRFGRWIIEGVATVIGLPIILVLVILVIAGDAAEMLGNWLIYGDARGSR